MSKKATVTPEQLDRWTVFSKWLKNQRESRELSQDEAAKSADVSRRQWIRYESGTKVLKKHISAIATALNLPINTVLQRAQYKPIRGVNSGLNKIHKYLKAGDPVQALQELLKVDAKLNNRVYNEEGAKNFAELLLQIDSLPKEQLERLLRDAAGKKENNIPTNSSSETAKSKYQKGQAVKFSPKAPQSWKRAMKRGKGKYFPATDKCVVVGFSPKNPKMVYVLQEFRKRPLRISMEFITADNERS